MVAVIVPLYNGGAFIDETLDRLLTQTYRDLDVVVVDDGSSDDGVDRVRRHLERDSRVRLVVKGHGGIAHTRNVGLAWLRPEARFVLIHDQDDVISGDHIELLVGLLHESGDAVGAFSVADYVDVEGRPWRDGHFARMMRNGQRLENSSIAEGRTADDVVWPQLFLSNRMYPPTAVLLRKEVVLEVGGYDGSYDVADDWDLLIRILRRGSIVMLDRETVGYRRHEKNASVNSARNVRETRAVWANTFYSSSNTPEDRRLLRAWWRAHQRTVSRRKRREGLSHCSKGSLKQGGIRVIDGLAHLALLRPLKRWRTRVQPLGSFDAQKYRLGSCIGRSDTDFREG